MDISVKIVEACEILSDCEDDAKLRGVDAYNLLLRDFAACVRGIAIEAGYRPKPISDKPLPTKYIR